MLGVEREEDVTVTALFSFVLRNLDGEERQIDDLWDDSRWYQHLPIEFTSFPDNATIRTRKRAAESVTE